MVELVKPCAALVARLRHAEWIGGATCHSTLPGMVVRMSRMEARSVTTPRHEASISARAMATKTRGLSTGGGQTDHTKQPVRDDSFLPRNS